MGGGGAAILMKINQVYFALDILQVFEEITQDPTSPEMNTFMSEFLVGEPCFFGELCSA